VEVCNENLFGQAKCGGLSRASLKKTDEEEEERERKKWVLLDLVLAAG